MTIYNQDGVRVDTDEELVSIYVEGVLCCEMTRDEYLDIALALMDKGAFDVAV